MMFAKTISRHGLWFMIVAALAGTSTGCSPGYVRVDPQLARKTLVATLEEWKNGTDPENLRQRSPEVVVQDMDWRNGLRLQSFEVVGDGEPVDANLIARVKLNLQSPSGKSSEKTVTYVVGTSPVLTVFRDPTR